MFEKLSDDEVINICKYLAVPELGVFGSCSRSVYLCCEREELWVDALRYMFPASTSFTRKDHDPLPWNSTGRNVLNGRLISDYPLAASKQKIKHFTKKSYNMTSVGSLKYFKSRFLHRCVSNQDGINYIFGGASTTFNTNFGSFSDMWEVTVNESAHNIEFRRIPIYRKSKKKHFMNYF